MLYPTTLSTIPFDPHGREDCCITKQMHTDFEPSENGIIQGFELKAFILGIYENIGGAVIGLGPGKQDHILWGRPSRHHIGIPSGLPSWCS